LGPVKMHHRGERR